MIHCNIRLCVGCRMCEVTCSLFHFGAVSPALSRIRVAKLEEIGIDMAVSCLSCEEKPCLECPSDALSVGQRGEIRLEGDLCSGCGTCAEECPVGAIGVHDELPLFCDLCDGSPSCVDSCPADALVYEENSQVSLKPFMQFNGNPARKRANYVGKHGHPLRESWSSGRRVDS